MLRPKSPNNLVHRRYGGGSAAVLALRMDLALVLDLDGAGGQRSDRVKVISSGRSVINRWKVFHFGMMSDAEALTRDLDAAQNVEWKRETASCCWR